MLLICGHCATRAVDHASQTRASCFADQSVKAAPNAVLLWRPRDEKKEPECSAQALICVERPEDTGEEFPYCRLGS
jgi:hypothetical protein